jgi:hypothetical protein
MTVSAGWYHAIASSVRCHHSPCRYKLTQDLETDAARRRCPSPIYDETVKDPRVFLRDFVLYANAARYTIAVDLYSTNPTVEFLAVVTIGLTTANPAIPKTKDRSV